VEGFMPFDPERAARVAYAAIRQLREEQGDERGQEWESLAAEDQSWYRRAVGLAAIGVRLPDIHADWCRGMESSGWSYGPELDRERRAHPGMLPWTALSGAQRHRLSVLQMITMALVLDLMSPSVPVRSLRRG
jgi:hypothetical protein